MKFYDRIFEHLNYSFNSQLSDREYDAKNIQFDCLKETIDHFEVKNGRTSDYGFIYMKYLVKACESSSAELIKEKLDLALAAAQTKN